ncbi:MAG: biotin--[acetyl-CoA-carboxylase] ligase [Phycisphaerales bacterium]
MSTTPGAVPLVEWPARLELALSECRALRSVRVVAETASTQDVARTLVDSGVADGLVVTTWRQTAGRGRLGRAWADTGVDGVAVTFALANATNDLLALAAPVATARTAEAFLDRDVGIKWPNDVIVDGRKLAGILVERVRPCAIVGIGVNVRQSAFEGELAASATSLRMCGAKADRCDVVARLMVEFDSALREDDDSLACAYATRDALAGRTATFATPDGEVTGLVQHAHPRAGIVVRCGDESRSLPLATTSVVGWDGGAR